MTNHSIEHRDGQVLKRFAATDRDKPGREWRGLSLLSEYAPGLAPELVEFYPGANPPAVLMSHVPGTPLRGGRVGPDETSALAGAVSLLCESVPEHLLAELPLRAWHQSEVIDEIEGWCLQPLATGSAPVVAQARMEGLKWLR